MDAYDFVKPLLFRLDPEISHCLAGFFLKLYGSLPAAPFSARADDAGLATNIFDRSLTNPVGLAAGFDKSGELANGLARVGFGFLEVGTVTLCPQPGNPKPRLFRLIEDGALINSMGFNNKGAVFMKGALQTGKKRDVVLGINIGKSRDTDIAQAAHDYLQLLEMLYDVADYFTLNISSPNTPNLRQLEDPQKVDKLLDSLASQNANLARSRGQKPKPLFLKVSPDVEENTLRSICDLIVNYGVGLVATNTTVSRNGLADSKYSVHPGGLSGKPLFIRSTEMLKSAHRCLKGKAPLIGVGGIFNAEDAYAKIKAGANAVQIYTGFIFEGAGVVQRIKYGLLELMKKDGFYNIMEAVGVEA